MKENIEDYRKDGFINLDEYFSNNPSHFTYPYYIDGYDEDNFWTKVRVRDNDEFVYVKPRKNDYTNNNFNVYAELVYKELLKQVDIRTANSDLALYEGYYTTLSPNVLSKYPNNEFIINASELLESRKYPNYNQEYDVEDLYDAIDEYCKCEYLENDTKCKCIKDIQKVAIADIFTLSTDRDVIDYDFIVGKDESENEVLELAPQCHNTYSLGAHFVDDAIYDMLENSDILNEKADSCYFNAGVPDYKRDHDYSYWEDTLYYLIDEDIDNLAFARRCATDMDISKAINNVEENINSTIPSQYKLFMNYIFNNRVRNICECIGMDYYKLIDSREKAREMEEI